MATSQAANAADVVSCTPASPNSTAINHPVAASVLSTIRHQGMSNAGKRTDDSKTVASDYSGRCNVQSAQVLMNSTQKTVSNHKKRVASKGSAISSKRNKSGNVNDGMQITKATSRNLVSSPSCQITQIAEARGRLSARQRGDCTGSSSVEPYSGLSPNTQTVAEFAAQTSMEALSAISPKTTLDIIQANKGRSFTVYRGSTPKNSFWPTPELSQDWHCTSSASNKVICQQKVHQGQLTDETPSELVERTALPPEASCGASKKVRRLLSQSISHRYDAADASPFHMIGTHRNHVSTHIGTRTEDKPANEVSVETRRNPDPSRNTKGAAQAELTRPQQAESARHTISCKCDACLPTKNPIVTSECIEDNAGDNLEEGIINFAQSNKHGIASGLPTLPARGRKQNVREVDENEDYGGALLSEEEGQMTVKAQVTTKNGCGRPFVRKPFPTPVVDRSPIFGASSSTTLRVCFRLGEVLKTGSKAVQGRERIIIEMYARVTSSWRDPEPGWKQHFIFKDLYHDRPPHLEGDFSLWNQAHLWDRDSMVFLQADNVGIMCRAVAEMKWVEQKWQLEILNIWEASWDDVNYVSGIYCN